MITLARILQAFLRPATAPAEIDRTCAARPDLLKSPAPAAQADPVSEIAVMRRRILKQHPAPVGADVPRYGPPDFPFPIWSDADLERPDSRRFSGGCGPRAGAVLLKDRRKPWQKDCRNVRFDRTGTTITRGL